MRRRWMGWLLVVSMLLWAASAGAELVQFAGGTQRRQNTQIQPGTRIAVATATPMRGVFATGLWGETATDKEVRALLHGQATVEATRAMGLTINETAVTALDTRVHADGSREYTFTLADDLYFSDGSPIRAQDYVFSLLLEGTPAIAALGGTQADFSHIRGYDAYAGGQTQGLSGVRLLDDHTFSLHVEAAALPHFYGLALLTVQPYPLHVLAPGSTVRDDGQGAYWQGDHSEETLRHILLDDETGYVHHPRVTSGPYQLEAYDAQAQTVTLVANPYYKGNYEGQKPQIERIVLSYLTPEDMLAALEAGSVQLLHKATDEALVRALQTQPVQTISYRRPGAAYLAFACELSPVDSVAVRTAVSLCVDREALLAEHPVTLRSAQGYFGPGLWMAAQTSADTASYAYDLEEARRLLEADGWTLNAQGEPYQSGTDAVRYRLREGTLEPLTLRWCQSEESAMAKKIETQLTQAFAAVGIALETMPAPFSDMLAQYAQPGTRDAHLYFFATDFEPLFDPYREDASGAWGHTGLQDATLLSLAAQMRSTAPSARADYLARWQAFEQRFAELMPLVPLYSGLYVDAYTQEVINYRMDAHPGWASAMLYASMR